MKKNRAALKVPEGREVVAGTVARLLPLYSEIEEDQPDTIHHADPNPCEVISALTRLIDIMFPGRNSGGLSEVGELSAFLGSSLVQVWEQLQPEIEKAIPFRWLGRAACTEGADQRVNPYDESVSVMKAFFAQIPEIRKSLLEDVQAAYDGDPAALSFSEIKSAYPGLLAITSHRLTHELYKLNVPVVPRIMSEWTHTHTGIDIHPGAKIGQGFFIDHGTGVVIGETAEIGNRVKLYQGVTLGAKSFPLDEHGRPIKHIKRHPTVGDGVVIYSNASILGGDTVIGADSTIGGNVFVTESVPPGSLVVSQAPEPQIKTDKSR
jgi:serine O-acetyltransferase